MALHLSEKLPKYRILVHGSPEHSLRKVAERLIHLGHVRFTQEEIDRYRDELKDVYPLPIADQFRLEKAARMVGLCTYEFIQDEGTDPDTWPDEPRYALAFGVDPVPKAKTNFEDLWKSETPKKPEEDSFREIRVILVAEREKFREKLEGDLERLRAEAAALINKTGEEIEEMIEKLDKRSGTLKSLTDYLETHNIEEPDKAGPLTEEKKELTVLVSRLGAILPQLEDLAASRAQASAAASPPKTIRQEINPINTKNDDEDQDDDDFNN